MRYLGPGFHLGDLSPERKLAREGKLLSKAHVDFAEAGIGIAQGRKRNDASLVHLSEHQFGIGQRPGRRDLGLHDIDAACGGFQSRVSLQSQADQVVETNGRRFRRLSWSLSKATERQQCKKYAMT